MTLADLMDIPLLEIVEVAKYTEAQRVPGGWIFNTYGPEASWGGPTFVPLPPGTLMREGVDSFPQFDIIEGTK